METGSSVVSRELPDRGDQDPEALAAPAAFDPCRSVSASRPLPILVKRLRGLVRSGRIDAVPAADITRLEDLTGLMMPRLPNRRKLWHLDMAEGWSVRDELDLVKASCLISEVRDARSDLAGAFEAIRRIGNDSFEALDQLTGIQELSPAQIKLLGHRVWATLFLANAQSRRGHHLAALSLLELGLKKLNLLERPPTTARSHDLRARIAYSRGLCWLHIGQLADARVEFRNAVEHTTSGLEAGLTAMQGTTGPDSCGKLWRFDEERYLDEQRCAQYMIGKCFAFGLARVALGSGEVLRALTDASVGVALLTGSEDEDHRCYARIVYATCLRARFSIGDLRTTDHLARAETILEEVAQRLGQRGSRHQKRAAYELACVLLRRYESAKSRSEADAPSFLFQALELAEVQRNDERVTATDLAWNRILHSRIYRHLGEYGKARLQAEEVIAECGDSQRELKVAALIALGEAHREQAAATGLRDLSAAERCFQEALDLATEPSLNIAACRLHLILCAGLSKDPEAGSRYMRDWDRYKREISLENGVLLDLQTRAEEELNENLQPDFRISASEFDQYTWEELARRLRGWLVQRWELDPRGLDSAARHLEVARATLYNWRRDRHESREKANVSRAVGGS